MLKPIEARYHKFVLDKDLLLRCGHQVP